MNNVLEKLTSPLVALGWIGVCIIAIIVINILIVTNTIFISLRDSLWLNHNISAIWAFLVFIVLIPVFVITIWFIINGIWILANKGLSKLQDW